MKKVLGGILLILFIPSLVYGLIVMGSSTNTSVPFPIVVTNAATSITGSTATLNGTAYNYNSAGTSYFNYGLTSAYGSQTTPIAFTANTSSTAFSGSASGLSSSTYHFQACVLNAAGSACGSDLTFSTTGLGTFTRIGALTSPFTGAGQSPKLAIDIAGGYLYICTTDGSPGFSSPKLWRVRLSDFTSQGTLLIRSLNGGICSTIVLNASGSALYIGITTGFASSTNPTLYKVSTLGFSIISSIDMGTAGYTNCDSASADGYVNSIALDNSENVYTASANTSNVGTICKFSSSLVYQSFYSEANLNTLTSTLGHDSVSDTIYAWNTIGSVVRIHEFNTVLTKLNTYTPGSTTAAIQIIFDYVNSFAYFGTGDLNLVKINLTAFAGSLVTTLTGSTSVAIHPGLAYLYYGANTSPGTIRSQLLTTNVNTSSLVLNSGENGAINLAVDTSANMIYVALNVSPTKIVKVQLN